jgi:hypothetical protein
MTGMTFWRQNRIPTTSCPYLRRGGPDPTDGTVSHSEQSYAVSQTTSSTAVQSERSRAEVRIVKVNHDDGVRRRAVGCGGVTFVLTRGDARGYPVQGLRRAEGHLGS